MGPGIAEFIVSDPYGGGEGEIVVGRAFVKGVSQA